MLRQLNKRKDKLIIVASYAVGIAIIILLLHFAGFGKVSSIIMKISLQFFIITLALDLAGLIFYALTWHILLRGLECQINFKTTLTISLAGIFMCYVTPSGLLLELLRIVLANKEAKVPIGYGAATVVMHRILYTLGFVLCALSSYVAIYGKYTLIGAAGSLLLLIILFSLGFAAGMFYLSQRADILEKIITKIYEKYEDKISGLIKKYEPEKVVNSLANTISDFKNSFLKLRNKPVHLFTAFMAVLLTWIVDIGIFYVVFLALNFKISIWAIALTIVVGDFIQMTPIMIPGMLGILETVFTTTLLAFGVPIDVATSAVILARIATFWFDMPVTAVAASYYGIKYLMRGAEALKTT
ncbi:MAG: flippase-like domain-containing protein [archaeon GB-1867-005]|nr:flippase-like domain-containing protein [Candidatus Culexmicrobium cathedralense]